MLMPTQMTFDVDHGRSPVPSLAVSGWDHVQCSMLVEEWAACFLIIQTGLTATICCGAFVKASILAISRIRCAAGSQCW